MKASKILLTVGVLTVYIFFPAYRYYAFGAMLTHSFYERYRQHHKTKTA